MRAYLPSKINFNFTRIKENPYDGVENEYLSTLHRAKLKKIFRELLKTEKQSQFTNMQALTDFTTCLGRNMLNHVYSSFFVKLILKFSIFFLLFSRLYSLSFITTRLQIQLSTEHHTMYFGNSLSLYPSQYKTERY